MLKKIVVMIVFVLFVGDSVFADNTQQQIQGTEVTTSQTQNMKGLGYSQSSAEGGEAAAGASSGIYWDWNYSPTSIMRYPEYRVPPVPPGTAPLAWPFPQQYFLWNTVAQQDVLIFQREWNLSDVHDSIRRINYKGPAELVFFGWPELLGADNGLRRGKGFSWQIYLFDRKLRPKSKRTVTTIIQDVNMAAFSQKYTCIGLVGIKTEENLFIPQTIASAIEAASRYDWDVGFLRPGMNLVNSSSGISPGVSGVSGGIHNTFALVGGISLGQAKVTGEGAVSLILYRKNGGEKVPKDLLSAIAERDKEEKIPGVSVSPELMELYKKAENNQRR